MRKLVGALLGLVLSVVPALGADKWISPTGTTTWTNANSPATPASLASANSNALAGDRVHMLPGTYSGGIAPTNSGVSGARLVYMGAANDSSSVVVQSVSLTGKSHVTIKWLRSTGNVYVGQAVLTPVAAQYDSIYMVRGLADLGFTGSYYLSVSNCVFGLGKTQGGRTFYAASSYIGAFTCWTVRPTIRDCEFYLSGGANGDNSNKLDRVTAPLFERLSFTTYIASTATTSTAAFEWGHVVSGTYNDLTFVTDNRGPTQYVYAFMLRDSCTWNTFNRLNISFAPTSTNSSSIQFSASGATQSPVHQYNNVYRDCVFKTNGRLWNQSYFRRNSFIGCTFIGVGVPAWTFSDNNCASAVFTDSVTFSHSTFYATGTSAVVAVLGSKLTNCNISNNVFMLADDAPSSLVEWWWAGSGNTFNNNLYWSGAASDSAAAVKYSANCGATATCRPGSFSGTGTACSTVPIEANSRFGNPQFADPANGNFTPAVGGNAVGGWWPDTYVGAIPPGGGPPPDTCAAVTRPGRVIDFTILNGDATFTLPGTSQFTGETTVSIFGKRSTNAILTDAEWDSSTTVQDGSVEVGDVGGAGEEAVFTGFDADPPASGSWFYAARFQNKVDGTWSCISNNYNTTYGSVGDTTAPTQVTDLVAKAISPDSALLIFTAPSDNTVLVGGNSLTYYVRYRTWGALTPTRWDAAATTYRWTDISYSERTPGTTDTIFVTDLAPDKVYWFGIKAEDSYGNISLLSNSDSVWTPAMTEDNTGYPRYALYGGAGTTPRARFHPLLRPDSLTYNQTTLSYISRYPVVSYNPGAGAVDSVEAFFKRIEPRTPPQLRLAEPIPNVAYIQRSAFAASDTASFATDGLHERDRDGYYYYGVADSATDGWARYNPRYEYYLRQWNLQRDVTGWTRNTGWGGSDTSGALPSWLVTTGSKGFLWRVSPKRKGWFTGTNTPHVAGTTLLNANWSVKNSSGQYVYPDSMVALYKHLYYDRKFKSIAGDSVRWYGGLMMDLADPRLDLQTDIDVVRAGFPSGSRDSLNRQFTDAHVEFSKKLRRAVGRDWRLSANGATGTHYGPYLNGYMREGWPVFNGGNWFSSFWWFTTPTTTAVTAAPGEGGQVTDWHAFKYKPSLHWIFNFPPSYAANDSIGVGVKDTASTVEADAEFSLATGAMTGAWCTFGAPAASMARDTLYYQLWFDPYAVNPTTGTAEINSAYTGWLGAPADTFYQQIQPLTTTNMLSSDGGTFEGADSTKWTRTTSGRYGTVRVGTTHGYGGSQGLVAYVYNDTTIRIPADYSVQALSNKSWTVKSGQTWSVRFWARSEIPRPVHVWLRRNSNGANVQLGAASGSISQHQTRLWLTHRWRKYSWPIDVSTTDSTSTGVAVKLAFGFGDTTGTVYIDSVEVRQGKKDSYVREFANGVVLVNEDAVQDTVSFPRATRAIYAREANRPDLRHHGFLIPSNTPIYLPASSGTFLLWASDSLRPAAVTNLAAAAVGGNIRLTWTSAGNDSVTGTPLEFEVRYRNAGTFTDGDWDTAIPLVFNTHTPLAGGTADTILVDRGTYGLDPGSTFSFAIKTTDYFRQQSALSNIATFADLPPDTSNPAAVPIDSLRKVGRLAVKLYFRAPGEDRGSGGAATTYVIKYAQSAITSEALWSAARTAAHTTTPSTPAAKDSAVVHIGVKGTWYFAIRAVDDANNVSPFATNASVYIARRRGKLNLYVQGLTL